MSGVDSTLDLSFNLLRSIPDALAHLPSLQTVYFVQNRISKITGLEASVSLTSLELGGNKIRVRWRGVYCASCQPVPCSG
jgi:protein phosphatase 1 regulatory subunit 7